MRAECFQQEGGVVQFDARVTARRYEEWERAPPPMEAFVLTCLLHQNSLNFIDPSPEHMRKLHANRKCTEGAKGKRSRVKRRNDYRGEKKCMFWKLSTINTQIKEFQMRFFASQ